ncbi:glutamate racemase [Tepidibacter formicigenes]|uniref:Glutamate racemase n=1 Tax=Tepidibacter formicigenes DSM 15518 TaxID=1123349 RepID=A0A1M6NW17_9FIRM|nr:glutamate racemase [Tepidibacter formicigenes]SHJ99852.1 glutamate racemase [Tepidibacter formicigenes DSM 15518]
MRDLPIGVFDSGMGGISVLKEMKKLMPKENYIYYGDSKNIPYGKKTKEELSHICIEIVDYFIEKKVKAVVIACNTATSAAVNELRSKYNIPIIGIEPALKPAVEKYEGGKIAVLATEVTLREKKFNELMNKYKDKAEIIKIPAPKLVTIVENGIVSEREAEEAVRELFEDINLENLSSIVLGCTHYVFLKDIIKKVLGDNIELIDGGFGTALNVKNILLKMDSLNESNKEGTIEIINTSNDKSKIELSYKLLNT